MASKYNDYFYILKNCSSLFLYQATAHLNNEVSVKRCYCGHRY